jgi:DNA end-binding protein Ku
MPMPRSLWNGTVAFGLVRVPVKLHSATESKKIAFRERHAIDGAAIEHRRVCVKEGKEVPYGELVKGYEVSSGSYVVLSKEEIAVADGTEAHVVEIEHFVDAADIDPVYYESPYHLSPGKFGEESYRLLHAALKRSNRVGIGRFVFHNKAHLAAIRALEGAIVLHTMRFADEIVPEGEVEMGESAAKAPTKLEVDTAELLIAQLDSSFEPDAFHDTYRDAVMAVIERKARGEAIEAPGAERVTREKDLLTTLEASIEAAGDGKHRSRAPSKSSPTTKTSPAKGARRPTRTRGEH